MDRSFLEDVFTQGRCYIFAPILQKRLRLPLGIYYNVKKRASIIHMFLLDPFGYIVDGLGRRSIEDMINSYELDDATIEDTRIEKCSNKRFHRWMATYYGDHLNKIKKDSELIKNANYLADLIFEEVHYHYAESLKVNII